MLLTPRYSLRSFFLGLASGRIRMRGPDMNLATLADRPTIARSLQRVRLNPKRERVSFDHHRILRRKSRHR